MVDQFVQRASEWDSPKKIEMTDAFVAALLKRVTPEKSWVAFEVGAGTGLVGLQILPQVAKVVFEDTSEAMLGVLKQKLTAGMTDTVELVRGELFEYQKQDIDFVFSSMAFHHIPDIDAALKHLYQITKPGAILAIGDVRTEDGSFHHFESIPHKGFDTDALSRQFENVGFVVDTAETFNVLKRERTPGVISDYEQFMLIAHK